MYKYLRKFVMKSHYRPRHASSTIEAIINEASKVKVVLPNVNVLQEALNSARYWSEKVEAIQVTKKS